MSPVLVLGGLVIGVLAMPIVARLRDRVPGVPRELDHPPDETHPAELAYLWSAARGERRPRDAFRAQLLHLVQEGALEMRPVGRPTEPEDFEVSLKPSRINDPDAGFVRFLFSGDADGTVSLKEATQDRRRGPLLASWLMSLRLRLMAEVDRTEGTTGMFDLVRWATNLGGMFTGRRLQVGRTRGRPEMVAASILAILAASIGQFSFLVPWVTLGVPAAAWLIARLLMPPRLHPVLRSRLARWAAFRRYLSRTSMEEAPAGAIVLWERNLVWAVALGLGEEVERQIAGRLPPSTLSLLWTWTPAGWAWLSAFPAQDLARYVQQTMPGARIRWPGSR